VFSRVVALLHPRHDVTATGNFPLVDVWYVAQRFEFVADPEGPIAIAVRVTDEYIRHAQPSS
jgi:hypothetical protein